MTQFKYFFVVLRCDNRIRASINGSEIYNKYVDFDPAMNDKVEITNYLQSSPSTNVLNVQAFNGQTVIDTPAQFNPYHFTYNVQKVNNTTGEITIIASNDLYGAPQTQITAEHLVMSWSHVIVRE